MDVVTEFINKIAYKFPKGYPDLNDPADKKLLESLMGLNEEEEEEDELNKLINRIKQGGYSEAQLKSISSKLDVFGGQEGLDAILKAAQITDSTIGIGGVGDIIGNYLAATQDLDSFIKNHDTKPLTYSDISTTGNLISIINQGTGVDNKTIQNIINIKGQEGGRGVGKGEAALALFFNDVLKSTGDGDNVVNGKPLEVKGTAGRLGKRGRAASRNNPLLQKVDDSENVSNVNRFDIFLPQLIQDGIPPKELYKDLDDFIKEYWPSANPISDFLKVNDLDSQIDVRKAIQQVYASNYLNGLNYDQLIFINTEKQPGSYYKFDDRNEFYNFINQNTTRFSSPIGVGDLDPQVFVK